MAFLNFSIPEQLMQADKILYQVLYQLDNYAKNQAKNINRNASYTTMVLEHIGNIDEVMIAVKNYRKVVYDILLSTQQGSLTHLNPREVLALRRTDSLYQLGYCRGLHKGAENAANYEKIMQLYSQYAILPTLTLDNSTVLIESTQRRISELSRRYDFGVFSSFSPNCYDCGTV